MAKVNPFSDNYPRVSPYIIVAGAAEAIAFYCSVLGATERMRMPGPAGTIGHAEIVFGDSLIMLADEAPDMEALGPKTIGGTPVLLSVYVPDVDAVVEQAEHAGATVLRAPQDQFYGDRTALIEDPWGHRWSLATHIEDVPPDEMAKRAAAMASGA